MCQVLNPIDVERILRIPLGDSTISDKLVWHFDKNGSINVRSVYHFLISIDNLASPSVQGVSQCMWKSLWYSHTIPKIKIFWWKVLNHLFSSLQFDLISFLFFSPTLLLLQVNSFLS